MEGDPVAAAAWSEIALGISPLMVGAVGYACCFVLVLVAGRQSAATRAVQRQVGLPGGSA